MNKIKGILCALVTPLDEREDIDIETSTNLIKHVLSGGVSGIIALGSTGEQIALTRKAKKDFVSLMRQKIPDGVPLIVGTGSTSTRNAIQNSLDAKNCAADAVIVTPPCFYPFGDEELIKYYEEIVQAIDMPVYLYNISRYTKTKISPRVIRELSADSRIVGIKESDRDIEYLNELIEIQNDRPDFNVIQGSDRLLLHSFNVGCAAGVAVTANMVPKISVNLYNAFIAGKIDKAKKLQEEILQYVQEIIMYGKFPTELKTVLSWSGLSTKKMTSPFIELKDEEEQQLKQNIKKLILK